MDQDSFRRLLDAPATHSRVTVTTTAPAKPKKTIDASQPAFKPRKVKKSDPKYRDRAAERRVGEGNDYAQVEAVLEEFEKRTADQEKTAVDEQRRYLGGDGEHTILVKGLDISLLEQNKSKAALSTEDDDSLEKAFLETTSEPKAPQKRTREDLLRELKAKRSNAPEAAASSSGSGGTKDAEEERRALEEAKKKGKFKPIGFKPIGSAAEDVKEKKKKKKVKVDGERKKKKKVSEVVEESVKTTDANPTNGEPAADTTSQSHPAAAAAAAAPTLLPTSSKEPEPEPPEDVDIFAGAGEYEGVEIDDDPSDNEADKEKGEVDAESKANIPEPPNPTRRWFANDEPEPHRSGSPSPPSLPASTAAQVSRRPPNHQHEEELEEGEEEEVPMRLVPLESSSIPSIKDILAMDKAAGSSDKKRKRKDKKGQKEDGEESSKKLTAELKAERDYKRLKSYTEKKAKAS